MKPRASAVTHPSLHGEPYPLVCVDEDSRKFHAGWLASRVAVDAAPVVHTSHRAAEHDQEWYSHNDNVAERICLPANAAVGHCRNERATHDPPSSE
jgi:hypothetical protein